MPSQPFVTISSRDNPLFKQIAKLQQSGRFRKEAGLSVLEGVRLCLDAAASGCRFQKLIVSKSAYAAEPAVGALAAAADECFALEDRLFAKLSDTVSPQGVICVFEPPKWELSIRPNGRYVALERLQDPSNLGAISRTAEALGIDGLILSVDACDPFSPKSLRASMGALVRLPVLRPREFLSFLREIPLPVYACVVEKTAKSVGRVDFSGGGIALIGNEAKGLSNEALAASDERITIPMPGRAESLNAAVAASIVMWEMVRE